MSKAEDIRLALKGGKKLTKLQIEGAIGQKIPNIYAALKRNELVSEGSGAERTFRLNPDFGDTAPRRKKTGRKGKSGKRGGGARTIKDVASALLSKPKNGRDRITALALDNYREASAQLRRAVVDQVEGYEHDTVLSGAIVNHQRAEEMALAAGAF